MANHIIHGISPGQYQDHSAGKVRFDPDYETGVNGYRFEFTDGDGTLGGDATLNGTPDDSSQYLEVYDAAGNLVRAGQSYIEQSYRISDGAGQTINVYEVKIGNQVMGYLVDGPIQPGKMYQYASGGDVNASNAPTYSSLHDIDYRKSDSGTFGGGAYNDLMYMGDGADSVDAGGGNDTVEGGSGNDTLHGGSGNDRLSGGTGNDWLTGGTGNDTFVFANAPGNDTVDGNSGTDTLDFSALSSPVTVDYDFGGGGRAFVGSDTITFSGIERIILTEHDDFLTGGDDSLGIYAEGRGGNDTLWGGTGNDTFLGGMGNDDIWGDAGNDSISGGAGDDELGGDAGNDTVDGGDGNDYVEGGSGNDLLFGGTGNDLLDGGSGNDTLFSDAGADTLRGGDGTDVFVIDGDSGTATIEGGLGTDIIWVDGIGTPGTPGMDVTFTDTGAGNYTGPGPSGTFTGIEAVVTDQGDDTIDAGADRSAGLFLGSGDGDDSIVGGSGSDTIKYGRGDDTVRGGAGDDLIDDVAEGRYSGYSTSLYGEDGNDKIFGGDGQSYIDGGSGNDTIMGEGGNDTIHGGSGNDSIDGGSGNDTIHGGTGRDTIEGGSGNDQIAGGDDADRIKGGSGNDTISGDAGADSIDGGEGSDSLVGGDGSDTIYGGVNGGADTLKGDAGDDDLVLGAGDIAYGGTGDDEFYLYDSEGTGGTATIVGGEGGEDTVDASNGGFGDILRLDWDGTGSPVSDNYTITSTGDGAGLVTGGATDVVFSEMEVVVTGHGADTIDFSSDTGGMFVFSGGGADSVTGGSGSDTIYGGDGADAVSAGDGDDSIAGGAGADTIHGGGGNDTIHGDGGGASTTPFSYEYYELDGVTTHNLSTVGFDAAGNNSRTPDATGQTDKIDVVALDADNGGNGDTFAVKLSTTLTIDQGGQYTFDLGSDDGSRLYVDGVAIVENDGQHSFSTESATIDLGPGDHLIEVIYFESQGNQGLSVSLSGPDFGEAVVDLADATIRTVDSDDELHGGDGDDLIDGGAGDDTLAGDAGRDTLTGGAGDDTLTGGAGDDTFVHAPGDGHDVITDFGASDVGNTRGDGDSSNNDFLDLSSYYDSMGELRADQADDGILNQSNTTDDRGRDVDYSDNARFGSGSITLQGADSGTYTYDNTGIVCFAEGTRIDTPNGPVAVEDLRAGDLVLTRNRGAQPVAWISCTHVPAAAMRARPELRPVVIEAGALGPNGRLRVSRQHCVEIPGPDGTPVFVRAGQLARLPGGRVRIAGSERAVTYYHLLCPRHEVVMAEGCPCETFYPGPWSLSAMDPAARESLLALLPDLATTDVARAYGPRALPLLASPELRALLALTPLPRAPLDRAAA